MIIDALTHILPSYFVEHREDAISVDRTFSELFENPQSRIAAADELIREMDSAGVAKSVIAGFGWTDAELARRANDYLIESALEHPERLIAMCSVNPNWGEHALIEAKRCLSAGAVGIGELHPDTQGWRDFKPDLLMRLMRLARSYKVPIVIHSSEPVGHLYTGKGTMTPTRLLDLARNFPDNRLVFSHFGGGLPFYAQMPEVKVELENVWFDSAAAPFLYAPRVYRTTSIAAGGEKILFASDYPLLSQRRALQHLKAAKLSAAETERLISVNASAAYNLLP